MGDVSEFANSIHSGQGFGSGDSCQRLNFFQIKRKVEDHLKRFTGIVVLVGRTVRRVLDVGYV
jgi:hypothetical protein